MALFEKILALIAYISLPVIAFIFHKIFPHNKITPFLVPQILRKGEFSKFHIAKIGIAYILLGIWSIGNDFVLGALFGDGLSKSLPIFYNSFTFISFIGWWILWAVGIVYLFHSIFDKEKTIRVETKLSDYAREDELEIYISKLEIYTYINSLSSTSFFLTIGILGYGKLNGIGFKDYMSIPLGLSWLTTLFTGPKLIIYLNKTMKVLFSKGITFRHSFVLYRFINTFLGWIYAKKIIKFYHQNWRML